MAWTTMIAIFFVLWWLSLFLVLPWGVRSQHENGDVIPGTDPGAPVMPRIAAKLGWTTVVAGVLFGLFYLIYTSGLVSFERIDRMLGFR